MFQLAEHLHMTVADLLARLDSRELCEWQAFFALRHEEQTPNKPTTGAELRAAFAQRVVKSES